MNLVCKVTMASMLTVGCVMAQTNAATPAPAVVPVATTEATTVAAPDTTKADTVFVAMPSTATAPDTIFIASTEPQPMLTVATMQSNSYAVTKAETANVDSVRNGPKQTVMYGVHAGVGSIQFISDEDGNDMSGLSWNGGLVVSFPLNDYTASFEIEALLNYRLLNRVYEIDGESAKNRIQQYTIEIPLLLKFAPMNSRFQFLFGPQMAVSVYDHLKIYNKGKTVKSEDLLESSAREPIDWALVAGMGIMANPHVIFDFRFVVGISDMYSNLYVGDEYWSFTPVGLQMGVNLVF